MTVSTDKNIVTMNPTTAPQPPESMNSAKSPRKRVIGQQQHQQTQALPGLQRLSFHDPQPQTQMYHPQHQQQSYPQLDPSASNTDTNTLFLLGLLEKV